MAVRARVAFSILAVVASLGALCESPRTRDARQDFVWQVPRALPSSSPGTPLSLAAGDLDGDGFPELVVGRASSRGGRIEVLKGDARAVFPGAAAPPQLPFFASSGPIPLADSPDLLAVGDFDRDGRLDVCYAAAGTDTLRVLPGQGDLTFGEAVEGRLSGPIAAISTVDVDPRDGLADLAVSIEGDRPGHLVVASPEGAVAALKAGATVRALEEARPLVADSASLPPTLGRDDVIASIRIRLNRDAFPDVVALRRGATSPEVWLSSPAATFTVLSTESWPDCNPGDGLCVGLIAAACTGPCTLRAAMEESNASAGADTIQFIVPGINPVIVTGGDLVFTGPVTLDGSTQPAGKVVLQGSVTLDGGTSVVRGLVIQQGNSHGVRLRTQGGSIVEGCLIGTDPTGFFGAANGSGVRIEGAAGNLVGGTVLPARNVLSGNVGAGVMVAGAGASGNLVLGNLIGTTIEGTSAIPNVTGVHLVSAGAGNVIGGTDAGAGNLISGNGVGTGALNQGIVVEASPGTLIQGNVIGLNIRGDAYLGNSDSGIILRSAGTTVGGTAAAARNLISGNGFYGVVAESTATGTILKGNWIGPDAQGLSPLANGRAGVRILGASNVLIGGDTAGAGNIIGGNAQSGIVIEFGVATPSAITIQGNVIGLDVPGSSFLTNRGDGIRITSGSGVTVGGATPGARNVISGNERHGVFGGGGTLDVVGNYVGTDVTGTFALANLANGIHYENPNASGIVAGNVASGNLGSGIAIKDGSVSVTGNLVGVDASGTALAPNGGHGILVGTNRGATVVGGTGPGEPNLIAYNGGAGVRVEGPTPTAGVPVRGNPIFLNGSLAIDLATSGIGGSTPNDPCDGDGGANRQQNFPEVLAAVTSGAPDGPTRLKGRLDASTFGSYTLDVYTSVICGGPGFSDLRAWIDSAGLASLDECTTSFDLTVPVGALSTSYLLMTATSAAGDTSEVSACFQPALWGDLDLDGQIDLVDLLAAANVIVGNLEAGTAPFSADPMSGDVNRDDVIDIADLIVLQGFIVGNLASLPI